MIREIKEKYILIIAVYMQVAMLMLQHTLNSFFGTQSWIHTIAVIGSAIPMIVCAFIWIRRKIVSTICVYCLIAIVFLIHVFLFPENSKYFSKYYFDLLLMCIPSFINISYVKNTTIHLDVLKYFSFIVFALGEIIFIYYIVSHVKLMNYNMSYSYCMLLPAIFLLYLFSQYFKIIYLVASILSSISILIMGSRGALVCWAIFVALVIIFSNSKVPSKALLIILVASFMAFYDRIVIWLSQSLSSIGLTSRTLLLMRSNAIIAHDSGRSGLQLKIWEYIVQHPFSGNGIGSEYRIANTYSHNIFLDIWLHFGLVIGSFILLALIYILIKAFMKSTDKLLFCAFFCYGMVPLFVSGSYLQMYSFWIFLGYCFKVLNIHLVFKKPQVVKST